MNAVLPFCHSVATKNTLRKVFFSFHILMFRTSARFSLSKMINLPPVKGPNVVDSLRILQSTNLVLSLQQQDGQEACFALQADNRNKNPRQFLFPKAFLQSISLTHAGHHERVRKDSLNGHAELFSKLTGPQQQACGEQMANSLAIEHAIHEIIFQELPRYELRCVGIEEEHGFRNSIVMLVDRLAALQALAASYRPTNAHADRVHALLAIPLSALLVHDMSALQGYLEEFLSSQQLLLRPKLHVHFHIQHLLFPGLKHLWKSHAHTLENLFSLHNLAVCPQGEELGVLLTLTVGKSRVTLDLPGGKRSLGETSLECAFRETWEEIGIDLSAASIRPDSGGPWTVVAHQVHHQMSCFLTLGNELMGCLPGIHQQQLCDKS